MLQLHHNFNGVQIRKESLLASVKVRVDLDSHSPLIKYNYCSERNQMQKKFDMLIKHFVPPKDYELLDYLNPTMYYKSRTKKHAIKLVYKLNSKHYSNTLETESIEKALNMYKILVWYVTQKTNADMNNSLDFLIAEDKTPTTGW